MVAPLTLMADKTLLVRADASTERGVGHVMRCMALADAWQLAGGQALFAIAAGGAALEQRIRSRGAEAAPIEAEPGSERDAAITLEFAERRNAEWLLVDGYHFNASYLRMLAIGTHRLLLIADGEEVPHCRCDICVDPSPGEIDKTRFGFDEEPELLLGPSFALLRREFPEYSRPPKSFPDSARSILISLGGGDSRNVTLQVLRAVEEIKDQKLELTVVAGPSNPHRQSLEAAVGRSRHSGKVVSDAPNMPELMARADLAITAGGGTCYELCFMQVPMVMVTTADNQQQPVSALASEGVGIAAGGADSLDAEKLSGLLRDVIDDRERRTELAEKASRLVDGKGAQRIVEKMLEVERRRQKQSEARI